MRINKLKSAVGIGSALSLLAIATVPAIAELPQEETLASQFQGHETRPGGELLRISNYILADEGYDVEPATIITDSTSGNLNAQINPSPTSPTQTRPSTNSPSQTQPSTNSPDQNRINDVRPDDGRGVNSISPTAPESEENRGTGSNNRNNTPNNTNPSTGGTNQNSTPSNTNRSSTGTNQQTLNENQRAYDEYEGFSNDSNRRVYENDRSINERPGTSNNVNDTNNNQPVRGLW
ncbi:MAG: hypothetical protein HC890_10055 [Chloroflexaceae bacterium]|nr:hypothetical protein [Chloroflexaceae bacterium]